MPTYRAKPPQPALRRGHPLARGAVVYALAERGGTTLRDSGPAGAHLTTRGSPGRASSPWGPALDLTGTQDASLASPAALDSTDWSIAAAFVLSSIGSQQAIAARGTSALAGQFAWFIAGSGQPYLDIPWVVGGVVAGATNLVAGRPYVLGVVKRGTDYTLYLDGRPDGTASTASAPVNSGTFCLGSYDGFYYLNGRIDQFGFWPTALTASQMAALAADPFAPVRPAADLTWMAAATAGGGSVDATATPAALSAAVTLLVASASGTAVVAASALTGTGTLPAPAASGTGGAAPGALAGTGTLPAPTASGTATGSPGALTGTGTLPDPTASGTATGAPAALAGAGTLPAPAPIGGATGSPSAVTATGALPAPTAGGTATAGASSLTGTGTLPAATASGAGTGTATPASLTGTGTLPDPTAAGTASTAPGPLTAAATLPDPAASASILVAASALAASGTLTAPTPSGSALTLAPALSAAGTLPAVVAATDGSGTATTSPLAATGVLPAPAGTGTASAAATPLTATGILPAATGTAGSSATATTTALVGVGTVPAPAAGGGASPAPGPLTASGTLPAPTVSADRSASVLVTALSAVGVVPSAEAEGDPLQTGRDWDVYFDIERRLDATGLFDLVEIAGSIDDLQPVATQYAVAAIVPADWDETTTWDDIDTVSTNERTVHYQLVLAVRHRDSRQSIRWLDQLTASAQNALDGIALGDLALPAWTKLRKGRYARPRPPEHQLTITGEFKYVIEGYDAHDDTEREEW